MFMVYGLPKVQNIDHDNVNNFSNNLPCILVRRKHACQNTRCCLQAENNQLRFKGEKCKPEVIIS